jgi:hypothetical protein
LAATNKDGSTRTYLYLVETVRSSGKVRQEIVANLGRIERLQEKGLDSIIEGLARYSKKQWICSQAKELALSGSEARSWGPALVFGKHKHEGPDGRPKKASGHEGGT